MRGPLDEKILDPPIQISGISPEDAQVFKRELAKVIVAEAIQKAVEALPPDKKEEVVEKLNKEQSDEKRLKILQESIKDTSKAQQALKKYLEEDLAKFIEKLAITFAKETTPEKRQKLLELLSEA